MKIAFCTLTLRPYMTAPAVERGYPNTEERKPVWEWLLKNGFDGIDLGETWFNFYDASDEALVGLGEEIREAGLEIGGLSVLRKIITSPADRHVQLVNRHKLRRAVHAAGLSGAPLVNMSISPQPWEVGVREEDLRGQSDPVGSSKRTQNEDYAHAAEFLEGLSIEAEQTGVGLTLELHQNSIVDTADAMLLLLDRISRPNVKANPDLGNFYFSYATPEGSWEDVVRKLAPHTDFWHVKNIQRVYVASEQRSYMFNAPLAEGMIDYRRAMRIMKNSGFDGWISIEMASAGDPYACIQSGKRYLDELIEEMR